MYDDDDRLNEPSPGRDAARRRRALDAAADDQRPGRPIDPYRLFRAVKRGRTWLLSTVVIGSLIGIVIGKFVMPRAYESSIQIVYEGGSQAATPPEMLQPVSVRELRTLVDSVKLPANLRKIRDRREMGDRTLSEVGALIRVESDFDSNLVTFVATSDTPQNAARLAETVVEVFLENQRELERERRQDSLREIGEDLRVAQSALTKAQSAYDEFRREQGITDLSVERESAIAQAAELQAQADLAHADASALAARVRDLRGRTTEPRPRPAATTGLVATAADREELARARAELTEAQSSLTDEHPRVRALRARVAALQQRIASSPTGGGSGVSRVALQESATEQQSAAERAEALRALARDAHQRITQLSQVEGQATSLLARVRVAEANVDGLNAAQSRAEISARAVDTGFRVVSPATVPPYPLKDSTRYVVAGAIPGVLFLLVIGFCLVREFGKLRPHTAREVAFWGNGPVIGASTWPRDGRALNDLIDEMDDFLLDASGRTLVVPASEKEAGLVAPIADRLAEDGWRPTTFVGAAEMHLDDVRDPADIRPGTALVPRKTSGGTALAKIQPDALKPLDAQPWSGPVLGPSLRRAARLADRVLVVVGAGSLTATELAAVKGRLGRTEGVGFVVVGLDDDLVHLPDRAGPVDGFWSSSREH
jgi:uncharacterized protein involved in exopolysaccharide biosynthesis